MITHSIILFYNKPNLTIRCLQSVLASLDHAGKPEHRIFLVDNGSSAEAISKIRDLAAPGIEILTLPINQGFSKAMNLALRKCFSGGATQVAMFSNDVEVAVDFYKNINGEALAPEATWQIQCPRAYFLLDREKPSYTHGTLDTATGALKHEFDPAIREISFPNYYPAAAMIWGRKAFEALQGFDEKYFCYWEDVDLSRRTSKLGGKIKCISNPKLKIHHLGRGTTAGKKKYSELFEQGKKIFSNSNPLSF
jgi:GT2 family glycosyltransferase